MTNEVTKHTSEHARIYETFIEWYVIPQEEKEAQNLPTSLDQFCISNSTTRETLTSFLDSKNFHNDVYQATINWARLQAPRMFHMLAHKAIKGSDPREMKNFLKLIIEADRAQKDQLSTGITVNLSINEEQYSQILRRETGRLLEASSE